MITEEQGHCLLPWDLSLSVKHITQTRQGGPGRGVTPCRAQHNCNYARDKVTIQACAKESIGQEFLCGRQSDSIVGTRYGLEIWQPPECACITIKGATGAEFNYSGPRKLCPMVPFKKYHSSCNHCLARGHLCHFNIWSKHCAECLILGLLEGSFGSEPAWKAEIEHRNEDLACKKYLTLLARRCEIMPHAEAIFCDHFGGSRFMIQEIFCGASPILISLI
ncbi:hypothetical protein C8R43DRAFT_940762 [Mycena crocata]|nr:hypothetical protein C8R43DRAFT_940762 [Mycena crocata]